MTTTTYDVAVIGGGAAGLSAALVLGRARRRVAVIDGGAPRNAPAAHMQGFLSRDGMPPAAFLQLARDEVRGYGVDLIDDEVVAIEPGFTVRRRAGDDLSARTVLLATGAVDVLPDIEGARERWGRDFLHCPYCHGWEVRDQPLGVLGTAPGSAAYAHLIRQWSDDVVFFAHTQAPDPGLEARGIRVVHGRVARLHVVDDRLHAVVLEDGRSIERAALFMRPTLRPRGEELLDPGTPGVWIAGNAGDERAQVITAAGQGSAAAIEINNHLVAQEIA